METLPKTKNPSNSNAPATKLFFFKSGKESFFSEAKENKIPFFGPDAIQAKLSIGQPNDQYEQEADAIAERVVGGEKGLVDYTSYVPNVQSMCAECSKEEENVQRMQAEEEFRHPNETTIDAKNE